MNNETNMTVEEILERHERENFQGSPYIPAHGFFMDRKTVLDLMALSKKEGYRQLLMMIGKSVNIKDIQAKVTFIGTRIEHDPDWPNEEDKKRFQEEIDEADRGLSELNRKTFKEVPSES